jgi:prepilin-type N-terminal cleavage/methylation domain-containing protein
VLAQIRKARQSESGFTLIELLLVIVIIGILAGIAVFAVSGITDRGAVAACKADAKTVQVASEAYFTKNGTHASAIGTTGTADTTTLIGGGFLKTPPGTGGTGAGNTYAIAYNATTGDVTASGACTI